jgi:hypothetical protein
MRNPPGLSNEGTDEGESEEAQIRGGLLKAWFGLWMLRKPHQFTNDMKIDHAHHWVMWNVNMWLQHGHDDASDTGEYYLDPNQPALALVRRGESEREQRPDIAIQVCTEHA